MKWDGRLILNWGGGVFLILLVFYSAVSWLWRASEESAAASLRTQVISSLSADLAEGNLFKLGATLSKLRQDGQIRFAEIREINNGGSHSIYRTTGDGDSYNNAFLGFNCGDIYRLVRVPGGGIGLITILPSSLAGAECTAAFISSDLPVALKRLKTKITISFGALISIVMGFVLMLTLTWHKRVLALEVLAKTAMAEKEAAIGRLAAQVAHDIRSPLVALDAALKDTAELPEKKRIIVRHAVNRIRDIANNLLEKNRQQTGTAAAANAAAGGHVAGEPPSVRLLSSLIDPVITEKRLSFESKPGINIDFKLTRESYGLFASIAPVEFRRLLSNLVNNAVEALGDKGAVDVRLAHEDKTIILTVSDDGKGIPPEILAKLGRRGETHGKAGGSGLGLFHARTTAESWGGSLEITSAPGHGTAVTIKLPKAAAPAGFVPALELPPGKPVVVLDDDATIHQVWQGRFDAACVREHSIEIIHFSGPDKLRAWVKAEPAEAKSAVCLFDYELLGFKETGLSLAEELGLCGKAILVTSRCEEPQIIEECARLNIRMIPKVLAGFVPITIAAPAPALAVLIDDDAMVHMNWETAAEEAGVELKAFKTPAAFLANLAAFPKDTPIYIDSELEAEIKGEDIAADLKEKGFTNLRLATGHPPEKFSHLPWLKVTGKESPWQA